MVFVIQEYEPAIACMCLPSILNPPPTSRPFLPSKFSQSTDFGCPVSHITVPLTVYFTYGNVYVSGLFSQIIHPLLPPLSPKVCSVCLRLIFEPAFCLSPFSGFALFPKVETLDT